MTQPTTEETKMEVQEEESTDGLTPRLEEVLEKTLSVFDPLEIKDHAGNTVEITKEQFIKYYMPSNASDDEKFHCYQAVRATGLSLFAPGECYFFKTGDGPIKLFTGYMAYLRKAYAAGLEHIETPAIDFGDDPGSYPVSAMITINIKDREPMTWPTYFAEVAGTSRGELNSRWKKAPIQMLIKCAIVNILRLSGLVDFTMPYTIDEMPDPVVDGYRTLTQEQIDRWKDAPEKMVEKQEFEKAVLGEVNAANHQTDLSVERRRYFIRLEKAGITFPNDEDRRKWQAEQLGEDKASMNTWVATDYMEMGDIISEIRLGNKTIGKIKPESQAEGDPPDPQEDASKTAPPLGLKLFLNEAESRFKTPAERDHWIATVVSSKPVGEWSVTEIAIATQALMALPEIATDDPTAPKTQEPEEEGKGDGKESTGQADSDKPMTRDTLNKIRTALADFPDLKYQTMKSVAFREFATKAIGRDEIIPTLTNCDEAEGQKILVALAEEKSAILYANLGNGEPVVAGETVAGEIVDDDPLNQEDPDAAFDLMVMYLERAELRFADKDARQAWESEKNLPPVPPSVWKADELKRGIALLEGVTPLTDVSVENPELITDTQYGEMETLIGAMPERFHNTLASEAFRTFAGDNMKPKRPWPGIKDLTEVEAGDIIHAMNDLITDEKKRIQELQAAKSQ